MDAPQIIAGRFRVEHEIGRGGMGTVYRAMHLGLVRPVAVKILKEEFANYPEVTQRFMREARTMARLRHPRAAIIFDAGRLEDGRPFIVMEYVEGETLAERIAREGRFTPEAAVKIAVEICDVLAEAHRLGIVHRDLKPSNIMMGERGVCVLDFGIAKVLATASSDATLSRTHLTTGSGAIIGTPRYMSPEQCLGHKVSTASDLYSVGVLLYEMLTGRPPFTDALASAVLVKQATKLPPPLPSLRDDIPHGLTSAVHTLLAKRPEQRPTTAALAGALLQRSVIPSSAQRTNVEMAMPLASTLDILRSNRRSAARTVAALVVLTMCGALFFAWSQSSLKIGGKNESDSLAHNNDSATHTSTQTFAPPLTPDTVQRIVFSVVPESVGDARIVRVRRGESAIAALHNERETGTTQLYLIRKRKGNYRITERMALDAERGRGLKWTTEVVDADGDGSEEVICAGMDAKGNSHDPRRFVLYVPRTGKTYSLQLAPDKIEANVLRAQWSPNILAPRAARYRSILRRRAESSVSTL
ncbi:MAG: serine/threonine protein kinase [Pyrinomonadaceae bacterium]|nr:serine/threonine protein kinase [Pyrinomonadaceae bacterium]